MTSVLAFTGKIMTGKTTCSKLIVEMDTRFYRMSFAEVAKREYCDLAGLDRKELDIPRIKENYRSNFISFVEDKKEKDKYHWAKVLFSRVEEDDFVVIDDLRFIEELDYVCRHKGVVYKVFANPEVRQARGWSPNEEVDTHYSETELDLSADTFHHMTGGGVVYNNEVESDIKLRAEVYKILTTHFS